MQLKLVRLEEKYRRHVTEMMDEWLSVETDITPHAIGRHDCHDFENYLTEVNRIEPTKPGHVPGTTYFCLDEERDIFVGAVNIRHYLTESLMLTGGHIGDGVRPSERRKGVATAMIGLALEKCRELGIDRVLMTCDKWNVGSAKSIMNNGGVLENEVVDSDGETVQRFWIEL